MEMVKLKTKKVLPLLFIALYCLIAIGSVSAANNTTNVTHNSTNSNILSNSDWPNYHNDASNTGQSKYSGPNTNTTKWTYQNIKVYGTPVIGKNGMIYVGSANGILYAFDSTGKLKWTLTTRSSIMGSPTIGNDGTIYFSNWMNSTTYAVNPNGTILWKCHTGNYNSGSSPVIGKNGIIYVATTTDTSGTLYAISKSGVVEWKYIMGKIYGTSPVIGSSGTIYMVDYDGVAYAITPNGKLKWSFKLQNNPNNPKYNVNMVYDSLSLGPDGTIYVTNSKTSTIAGNVPRSFFYLFAISDNGTNGSLKWVYTTNITNITASIQEPLYGVPAISSDGRIYVVSASKLYAINTKGKLIWSIPYDVKGVSGTGLTSAIIDSKGTIYVGGRDGLFALNRNGTIKWTYATGEIVGSPSIGHDGSLYVGTIKGVLYAFNSIGADFSMKNVKGTSLTQQFSANSNGSVKSWKWNFGDGTNSTKHNPTHKYNKSGYYTVILTVTLNNGNLLQITKVFNIVKRDIKSPIVTSNIKSGTYTQEKNIKINAADDSGKATIYYTTDGTNPQSSATKQIYTYPISIDDTTTLKFTAVDPSNNWSPIYTDKYIILDVIYVQKASYYTNGSLSKQIQHILNNAASGSIIVFKGSSYDNLQLVINKKLSLVSNIGTKINVSNPSGSAVFLINSTKASGSKIIGFTINSTKNPGILINNANNITISNNRISSTSAAIRIINSSKTNIIKNQFINSLIGISILNSDNIHLSGNNISKNSNVGVFIYNSSDITLINSQITKNGDNKTAGINSEEGGAYILNSKRINILNNNISNNSQGITVRGQNGLSSAVLIKSNKINDNYGEGILLSGKLKNITASWNYIERNANGIQMDYSNGQQIIIQSNYIASSVKDRFDVAVEDSGTGINFGSHYQSDSKYQTGNEIVQYNVITGFNTGNSKKYVSGHDTSDKIDELPIGLNVYDYHFEGKNPASFDGNTNNFCHKIRTEAASLVLVKVAPNVVVAEFQDANGNSINNLLPNVSVDLFLSGTTRSVPIGQKIEISSNNIISAAYKQMSSSLNVYSSTLQQNYKDTLKIYSDDSDNSNGGKGNNNNENSNNNGGNGTKPGNTNSRGSTQGPATNTGISSPASAASSSSAAGSEGTKTSTESSTNSNSKIAQEIFPITENKNVQIWSIIGIILLLIIVSVIYYRKEILTMLKKSKK